MAASQSKTKKQRRCRHPMVVAYHQGLALGVPMDPILAAYAAAESMLMRAAAGHVDAESSVYRLLADRVGVDAVHDLLHYTRLGEASCIVVGIDCLVEFARFEDRALRAGCWAFSGLGTDLVHGA
jgi:hypothetical protein